MTLFAATEAPAGGRAGRRGWGGNSAALEHKELTLTPMPNNGSVLLLCYRLSKRLKVLPQVCDESSSAPAARAHTDAHTHIFLE